MGRTFYRTLLVIFSVWGTLLIPTLLLPVLQALQQDRPLPLNAVAAVVGFALLPVAAIGLWCLRLWGLGVLVAATLMVAIPAAAEGIQSVLGLALLHLLCLCLPLIRGYFARREQGLPGQEQTGTQSSPPSGPNR